MSLPVIASSDERVGADCVSVSVQDIASSGAGNIAHGVSESLSVTALSGARSALGASSLPVTGLVHVQVGALEDEANDDAPLTIRVPPSELAGPLVRAPWTDPDLRDEASRVRRLMRLLMLAALMSLCLSQRLLTRALVPVADLIPCQSQRRLKCKVPSARLQEASQELPQDECL